MHSPSQMARSFQLSCAHFATSEIMIPIHGAVHVSPCKHINIVYKWQQPNFFLRRQFDSHGFFFLRPTLKDSRSIGNRDIVAKRRQ